MDDRRELGWSPRRWAGRKRLGRLALRVLEALAGAGLPVLLALLLPRVAREEAGPLEGRAALGVGEHEGAGDAVAHGLGLGAVAAACDGRLDVVLIEDLEQLERLAHDHARGLADEVLVGGALVDG